MFYIAGFIALLNLLQWSYGISILTGQKGRITMKYFCENAPQYHIASAGSLLGIALANPTSFLVGKVNFMQIAPMTFEEFLLANGDDNLAAFLESLDTIEPIPDAFFNTLYKKLKMYYVTGGMPKSVLMWTKARDVPAMQETLQRLVDARPDA